ncbi:Transcriptional regulator [Tenacibaculum sp. 190130A14a]|uniref:Transcriptional regulator n=1 Tax=Tenacibaculum polynesiense TaxID=3137857 RepID=A0ABM9PFJ7_9FLAO
MSFFGKNIKKIRGVKGMSQQAFAELFDLKRATLGAYEEGRSEPKIETIIKIANYFSITIDDILTSELTVNALLRFKGDVTIKAEEVTKREFLEIPLITKDYYADYVKYYDKPKFIKDLPVVKLPIEGEAVLRGLIVPNLEMTSNDKGLYPGDMVVGKQVGLSTVDEVKEGNLVLAVVEEELILRRIFKKEATFVFRADHKNIDDKVFDKKAIKELWNVQYVFLNRLPEFHSPLEDKLSFLEQEFSKLKNRL